MIFFFFSLIIILFTKEFILINQELIIYITFLTITLLAIQTFSFLKKSFIDIQNEIKNNLINISLNTQKAEQTLLLKAMLTTTFSSFIDVTLLEPETANNI